MNPYKIFLLCRNAIINDLKSQIKDTLPGNTGNYKIKCDLSGRSVGYTYAKNGSVQQTVSTGYGVDGRIASAGFVHGGAVKQFGYAYLNGTNLLQTLTMPNNMSLAQSFEEKRDLLTQMDYKRGNTLVSRRVYTYDTLARPLTRTTSRQGQTINDSFVHTYRSELASAQVNGEIYGYDYDNIGNRRMAMEASDYAFYEANNLNQYSSIQRNEEEAFVPSFDADGNQTLVRTATGIWSVSYNAENRPVIFQKITDSVTTRITCSYDSMGRRATKKVEEITTDADGNESANVITHHRFIYRGYLQIACCDLSRSGHPCLWLITWDPTQPVATRPLAIQKDGTWFCYGWDLTKNICEVFGQNGYIRTAYSYTPYGSVTANGDITQPIQWSSEFADTDLALVYYNYRHYNPMDGRWLGRDPIETNSGSLNFYRFNDNVISQIDSLGLLAILHCYRFKWVHPFYKDTRFTSECYLYEIKSEKNDCCLCKEEIEKLNKITSDKLISDGVRKVYNCMKTKNPKFKPSKYGPLYANLGKHSPKASTGNGYGKEEQLPAGWYRITPYYKSDNYGALVPAITGLNMTESGSPVPNRNAVLIHNAWGNRNYETKGCLAFINGADKYLKTIMLNHKNCGGLYLQIVDKGEASKKLSKRFREAANELTKALNDAFNENRKKAIELKVKDYSVPSKLLPTPKFIN